MINNDIEPINIVKIDIIKGRCYANLKILKEILLAESNNKLSTYPYSSRYEDTYCPPHPVVDEVINKITIDFKQATGRNIVCSGYWGHIHEKNMSTNTHDHGTEFFSAVFYISVPEHSGDLVFAPRINPYNNYAFRSIFKPMEGYYYMFPSYIDHYVPRNNSEEKRISISFNFRQVI